MEFRINAWKLYWSKKVFKLKGKWSWCLKIWWASENKRIFEIKININEQKSIHSDVNVIKAYKNVRYKMIN
jgi:hypothetical protein